MIRLLLLSFQRCFDLDRQTEQVDKACSILLVVSTAILTERGNGLAVKGIGGGDACVDDVALIKLELYVAADGLLRLVYESGERFAQGSEPLTVVNQLAKLDCDLLLVVLGITVQRNGFQNLVCVVFVDSLGCL